MAKTPEFKFVCCAVDCGDACEDEAVYRIPTALMNRATYSNGGGLGRSLRFNTGRADELDRCYVCGEHAMQSVLSVFGRGLAEGMSDLNPREMLVRLGAWLDFTERGLTPNEIANRGKRENPWQSVGDKRRKAYKDAISDAVRDCTEQLAALDLAETAESGRRRSTRLGRAAPPLELEPVTPEEKAVEDELLVMMRLVLDMDLLPNDTRTYCLIHNALRHLLIAARVPGWGTAWSTREAQELLRFFLQHPTVFTRRVLDTFHGVGMLGLGSHHSGPWDAAHRCSIVGTPSYRALQDFKPPLTANLIYPNVACAEMFNALLRKRMGVGPDRRIKVAMTVDMSDGGGESKFSVVDYIDGGVAKRGMIGAVAQGDGSAVILTPERARQLVDAAKIEAATGIETCLLHAPDGCIPGGFLAGLVPCKNEKGIAEVVRLWRALLIPLKIELAVLGADMANKKAVDDLNPPGTPKHWPKVPVWERDTVPTHEQMLAAGWNYYPLKFAPDYTQHTMKHLIYALYEVDCHFGDQPKDKWNFGTLLYNALGAETTADGRYILAGPDDESYHRCNVRGVKIEDLPTRPADVKDWLRRLCERVGVRHLGVLDSLATQPAVDVARCWDLFAEIGETTVSKVLKAGLELYMASLGCDLEGDQVSPTDGVRIARKAFNVIQKLQAVAATRGTSGKDKRPRGGWPKPTIDAIELAIAAQETWIRWNKADDVDVSSAWVSSRWNEVLHSVLKRDGGKFLDLPYILRTGDTHQVAQLLRSDCLHVPLELRRGGRAYAMLEEWLKAIEERGSASMWDDWDPLHTPTRRRRRAAPVVDPEADRRLRDVAARLTNRSESQGLPVGMRQAFTGGARGRNRPKSRKGMLTTACEMPSSIPKGMPQVYRFDFPVEFARLIDLDGVRELADVDGSGPFPYIAVAPGQGLLHVVVQQAAMAGTGARTRSSGLVDTKKKTDVLSVPLSDVFGLVFSCVEEAGPTSQGVTDVTFGLLRGGVSETDGGATGATGITLLTGRMISGDFRNLSKIVHVPVLETTPVATKGPISARMRVMAAATAALVSDAVDDPMSDDDDDDVSEAVDDPMDVDDDAGDADDVAVGLGGDWPLASHSVAEALRAIGGLEKLLRLVADAVGKGDCDPVQSFAQEHRQAHGSVAERAERARRAHAAVPVPFSSLAEGARVVAQLPAAARADDADTTFFEFEFVAACSDDTCEVKDASARCGSLVYQVPCAHVAISPAAAHGSRVALAPKEVVLARYPMKGGARVTGYYPASVVSVDPKNALVLFFNDKEFPDGRRIPVAEIVRTPPGCVASEGDNSVLDAVADLEAALLDETDRVADDADDDAAEDAAEAPPPQVSARRVRATPRATRGDAATAAPAVPVTASPPAAPGSDSRPRRKRKRGANSS